jgi:uncharacterized protein (DUF3820 family)
MVLEFGKYKGMLRTVVRATPCQAAKSGTNGFRSYSTAPSTDIVLDFGKYKNKKLSQTPLSYRQWLRWNQVWETFPAVEDALRDNLGEDWEARNYRLQWGQHKDKKLCECQNDYLIWARTKTDIVKNSPDIKRCFDEYFKEIGVKIDVR